MTPDKKRNPPNTKAQNAAYELGLARLVRDRGYANLAQAHEMYARELLSADPVFSNVYIFRGKAAA